MFFEKVRAFRTHEVWTEVDVILMSDVCAKNILSVFAIFLLVLNLIVPLGALSAYFCGCLFEFVSIRAFYIVIALLAVALPALSLKIKATPHNSG